MAKIAERLFDTHMAKDELKQKLYDVLGEDAYELMSWDWYDDSLELGGVKPDIRLPVDLQEWLWSEGFARCWLNHTDDMQTYYMQPGDKVYSHVNEDRYPQAEHRINFGRGKQ